MFKKNLNNLIIKNIYNYNTNKKPHNKNPNKKIHKKTHKTAHNIKSYKKKIY